MAYKFACTLPSSIELRLSMCASFESDYLKLITYNNWRFIRNFGLPSFKIHNDCLFRNSLKVVFWSKRMYRVLGSKYVLCMNQLFWKVLMLISVRELRVQSLYLWKVFIASVIQNEFVELIYSCSRFFCSLMCNKCLDVSQSRALVDDGCRN